MTNGWKELLGSPGSRDHVAQVYQDPEFLIEAVAYYVRSGLERGEGIVLVMRRSNWEALQQRLQAEGADPSAAQARGQLCNYEAEATLARLMKSGMPDAEAFREVIGGAIAKAGQLYPKLRAFGEMVDILWQRGHRVGAQHLEELWNDYMRQRPFTLLCAYYMDPLHESAYGGPIENVCKSHTHLIPARHYGKFDAAVIQASEEVLDRPLASMLHTLATKNRAATGMPPGQATLMWLMENMPRTADRVLDRVRTRYSEESPRASG